MTILKECSSVRKLSLICVDGMLDVWCCKVHRLLPQGIRIGKAWRWEHTNITMSPGADVDPLIQLHGKLNAVVD